MITSIILLIIIGSITFFLAYLAFKSTYMIPGILAVLSCFHLIALVFLFNTFGLKSSQMNVIAAWKELLIIFAFCLFFLYWVQTSGGYRFRLNPVDKIMVLYLCVNIAYLFLSPFLSVTGSGAAAILNGFRIQTMMLLSYFAARMVTARKKGNYHKFFRTLVIFGTLISLVAIIEIAVNPIPAINLLGLEEYLLDVAGMSKNEITPDGVPGTYYSSYNNEKGEAVRFRRSASLFLSPLTFGMVLIVIIPITLALVLHKKVTKIHLVIQAVGLISTVSRGPIISVLVGCFCFLLLANTISKKTKVKVLVVFILFMGVVGYKGFDFIKATVTLRDASALHRVRIYYNSYTFMKTYPFGIGLAAAQQKFGERIGGGESEYFENVSRLGWLGLCIYMLLFLVILKHTRIGAKIGNREFALLSAIVFSITLGLFAQQFVNKIWRHPFLPFVYGWILGMWATLYTTFRSKQSEHEHCR